MSKNQINFIILFNITIILFLSVYLTNNYLVNQILLCVIFFYSFTLSLLKKKMNYYQIFLVFIFLFLIIKPFMSLISFYSFPEGNRFFFGSSITQDISNESMVETFKIISIFILGSSSGWLYFVFLFKSKKVEKKINFIKRYQFFNLAVIILAYLFYFYLISLINQHGYKQVVHTKILSKDFYKIYHAINILYPLYFIILLYYSGTSKIYLKNAILFLLPLFFVSFFGSRSIFVMYLVVVIFIYTLRFDLKYFSKILILLTSTFIIFSISSLLRNQLSITIIPNIISFENFLSAGNSLGVVGYTVEFANDFENKSPFLWGYIGGLFSNVKNYTIEGLTNAYLAQHLAYLLNENYFLSGATIGTSIVAEIYELVNGNFILIFLMAAIMTFLSGVLTVIFLKNIFSFYFCFYYFYYFFASPRGSIMKLFNKSFILGLTMILLFIIFKQLIQLSNKK